MVNLTVTLILIEKLVSNAFVIWDTSRYRGKIACAVVI